MDVALGLRGDWAMNDGYGLNFARIGRHAGEGVEWRIPLQTDSAIALYKLHGSLNWLYCRDPSHQLNLDLHGRTAIRASEALYCLDGMKRDFRGDHPVYEWWARYEHEEDDFIFDLHSLIVPPSVTKAYRSVEMFLGDLWGRAIVDRKSVV